MYMVGCSILVAQSEMLVEEIKFLQSISQVFT
jgi:hypothetical protein